VHFDGDRLCGPVYDGDPLSSNLLIRAESSSDALFLLPMLAIFLCDTNSFPAIFRLSINASKNQQLKNLGGPGSLRRVKFRRVNI